MDPTQVPRYSLSEVARVGGVNPSVFRNWQRAGIPFFNYEREATPAFSPDDAILATTPGQAHKLSGRVAINMLLSLFISKSGVKPKRANEIALSYTHISVQVSKYPGAKFDRELCSNYSNAKYTNLVICPATGKYEYFASDVSPTADEIRNRLGEYIQGVVHIDMNMFLSWAKMELKI
jgi:hypothetical protein